MRVSISQSRCLSFQVGGRISELLALRVKVSISQSRCLSFQGHAAVSCSPPTISVSISQSRCLSFQVVNTPLVRQHIVVSISQSRCLSFQDDARPPTTSACRCFNLAIEMLVISGYPECHRYENRADNVSISQSRCLSFQERCCRVAHIQMAHLFQSRNRDACHFRICRLRRSECCILKFQSRNRDACHFRCPPGRLT